MGELLGKNMLAGKTRRVVNKLLATFFITLLAIGVLIPFIYMISASFKTIGQLNSQPLELIVEGMTFRNYQKVLALRDPTFFLFYSK